MHRAVEQQLRTLFGRDAYCEGPLVATGAGRRLAGLDLSCPLDPHQVEFLLDALSMFRIVCISGQDLSKFTLAHFERFANHWGAPVPHPNNFMRGGKPAQSDGDSSGSFELISFKNRAAATVNKTFPGKLQCLFHESPVVLVVANFGGDVTEKGRGLTRMSPGGSWHTDIEYEPLPIYVSMFLAHKLPVVREGPDRYWVEDKYSNDPTDVKPYVDGSDYELMRLRKRLPLNGETAFADTAAAFEALPVEDQVALGRIQLRRRLNDGDEGWLAPLVRTNPRSGTKSLHSPIWASRPGVRPAVEVDGMSVGASRALLDQLETHVLQPQFRYDHLHQTGDVTLWDNYMTLHNSPPLKANVHSLNDARLLYRLSCKGTPSLSLPRHDASSWLRAHIPGGYTTPRSIIDVR